ncbi:unnamed protein product [Lota lota]
MADRRRRRRRASQDSEEDDESGSGTENVKSGSPAAKPRGRDPEPVEVVATRTLPKTDAESECESEDEVGEAVLSDYESADPEEENGSHSEGGEEREGELYSDEEASASQPQTSATKAPEQLAEEEEQQEEREERGEESKLEGKVEEKEGDLAGERQSGDGQESTDDPEAKVGQKLDDDEDRKNPAYIPRKGLFFEHDVRGHAQEEERPKGRNRKLWKDEGRWVHDRFREEEQAPKSRDELVSIYGYDIRNGGRQTRDAQYRSRRPRQSTSPSRDKRWGGGGGDRPVRSWHSGGGGSNRVGAPPPSSAHPSSTSPLPPSSTQRNHHPPSSRPLPSNHAPPNHAPPNRGFQNSRPSQHNAPQQSQYRNNESNAPPHYARDRQGPKAETGHGHRQGFSLDEEEPGVVNRTGRGSVGRGGPSVVVEEIFSDNGDAEEDNFRTTSPMTLSHAGGRKSPPPRRHQLEQRGVADRSGSSGSAHAALDHRSTPANQEASPPAERPVERKSYALARRTRSRPADLGSKQASVEETAGGVPSPANTGGKNWAAGEGPGQTAVPPPPPGLAALDQDLARMNLSGPNWSQNPSSYLRSELRGLPSPIQMPGGPPQFSGMEEMGVGASRAKRYSSQRQRPVPEPGPPLHLGVMEGHYYEPMSYQGPIYAHGESAAPIPPQGMLVQPEMHIPHPGLHPHPSGGPIANPTLYGAPPVSLSPGQPQQMLAPPFYPPPGVMTFPYPAMYPNPQAQSQVYGGVTYYDTMQQQAQPKPSPPRRSSQPVTVKPPPPEVSYALE